MSKIYFGKSNRANPNHVIAVRALLSEYGEVVEYTGGTYSHKQMLACDYLVILPELAEMPEEDREWVNLGRGLHEQIQTWNSQNPHRSDLMIINEFDTTCNEIWVGAFEDLDIADYDDYVNYSCALFDVDTKQSNLRDILEYRIGKTLTTSDVNSDYKYLLIKR